MREARGPNVKKMSLWSRLLSGFSEILSREQSDSGGQDVRGTERKEKLL